MTFNPVSNRPEYTGSMVIKTSSVCKLAQYGQVLVDDTTWSKVKKDMGDLAELRPKMTPVGEFTFTGFAAPERIVQVCPASLSLRNFAGVDANQSPSKPHLVRGMETFNILIIFFYHLPGPSILKISSISPPSSSSSSLMQEFPISKDPRSAIAVTPTHP